MPIEYDRNATPQIVEKTLTVRMLVLMSQEYLVLPGGSAMLDAESIPAVNVKEMPQGVEVSCEYRGTIITVESAGEGIVRIEFGNLMDTHSAQYAFSLFMKGAPQFVCEKGVCEHSSNMHFVEILKLPGETLDVLFNNAMELVDQFWDQHPVLLGEDERVSLVQSAYCNVN
jgi:hypothetical protein